MPAPRQIEPHVVAQAAALWTRRADLERSIDAQRHDQPRLVLRIELHKVERETEVEGLEAYQVGRSAADSIACRGSMPRDGGALAAALGHASPLYVAGFAHGLLAAIGAPL